MQFGQRARYSLLVIYGCVGKGRMELARVVEPPVFMRVLAVCR